MGSSSEIVRVYIGGDEYPIKGDVDIETTKKVAEYVDLKINEFQKTIATRDKMKSAVLSALNIAGELFDIKKRFEHAEKELVEYREKMETITRRINDSL